MKRKIIRIDEEKCTGCGLCVAACHEGALRMAGGKARLVAASYCDGLGDCLPVCPAGAITITAADEKPAACPARQEKTARATDMLPAHEAEAVPGSPSRLAQWPCQLRLVPADAPFLKGARLLVAADCTAFANADVHERFMKDRITLIGCPKLDAVDYAGKLAEILLDNDIQSIEVLRMSVPCCGGMESAVKRALAQSGKAVPWHSSVVATDGEIR